MAFPVGHILSSMSSAQVKFVGEDGIDEGGLSAEFFSLISQSFLTEKKLLEVCENSLMWFNSEVTTAVTK